MTDAYIRWDEAQLNAATWQGIEFLSFVNNFAGPPVYQAVVTIHLARPTSGLAVESISVSGGENLTNLQYDIVSPAVVGDYLQDGHSAIELGFPIRGDYSAYTITLRNGGNDPLHPFFNREDFIFYLHCPIGDCRPNALTADGIIKKNPAIDLKTKDYRGFMEVITNWIKATNPNWADLSPASFERMMTELLCHHADMLSYYQDRVANEAFIATARERHALRQHGLLLGYVIDDGEAATTMLAFDVSHPGILPADVAVDLDGYAGEAPLAYVTQHDARVDPGWNQGVIQMTAWPTANDAILPQHSTGLLLWGHDLGLTFGQRLALIQGSHIEVITLTAIEEMQLQGWVADPADPEPLPGVLSSVTRIAWQEKTQQDFYPWSSPFTIRGNLIPATYGLPRVARGGSASVIEQGMVELQLTRRNSIVTPQSIGSGPPRYLLRAFKLEEGPVIFHRHQSGDAEPALELEIDGEVWSREDNLWESRSYDLHYTAETDNDGSLWIHLGDGVHGRELEVDRRDAFNYVLTGRSIELRYRIGIATAGNCAPETLNRLTPTLNIAVSAVGVTQVTNVTPGQGGRAAEGIDAIRFAIPASIRHGALQRAVSLADYAAVAMTDQDVARAAALNLGGVFNTVLILIDPKDQGEPSPELIERVQHTMTFYRMTGREVRISGPEYVPIEAKLIVCPEPSFAPHDVRNRVLASLRPGTAEKPGFFHPDKLSFGDNLEVGDVIAHVQDIPGVRSVKVLIFRRLREHDEGTRVEELIQIERTEVARLDGNDNRPEHGILKVFVVGLDDESLIRENAKLPADYALFDLAGPKEAS